jgi:hypothetical protein
MRNHSGYIMDICKKILHGNSVMQWMYLLDRTDVFFSENIRACSGGQIFTSYPEII